MGEASNSELSNIYVNHVIAFFNAETCFPPWTEYKKRCYKVMLTTHRWKDAFVKCKKLRSHMVTISSEEENLFTTKLARVKLILKLYFLYVRYNYFYSI